MFRCIAVLVLAGAMLLLNGCSRDSETQVAAQSELLAYVPADTPYAFVTSRYLPEPLRGRMADHVAAELAQQRRQLQRIREEMEDSGETAMAARRADPYFNVADALLAEFEGRDTADSLRELGIDPVTRSAFYGIGPLPAFRVEIRDRALVEALLDRVERRAGMTALRGELDGQPYRRIDLGAVDFVLAVSDSHLVGGLLVDTLFDEHLPLLLGLRRPGTSLADSGRFAELARIHGFSGYGEGFIGLQALAGMLLGEDQSPHSQRILRALGAEPLQVPEGCRPLTSAVAGAAPRVAIGVTQADAERLAVQGIWETRPEVAAVLTRLAAPVAGVGADYDGLVAIGAGLNLPQVRNAISRLLDGLIEAGKGCEWIDPSTLRAITPQLNLALGPMTAGIKGFNLRIEGIEVDPDSLQPESVRGGLLAAVDDPRGVLALGAMFNPALASLKVPDDGTPVPLPGMSDIAAEAPPLQLALGDRSLLLLTGDNASAMAAGLLNAPVLKPLPIFALDYGIRELVRRHGGLLQRAASRLEQQGDVRTAAEVRLQLAALERQADLFERARIKVYADDTGLIMEQVMELH